MGLGWMVASAVTAGIIHLWNKPSFEDGEIDGARLAEAYRKYSEARNAKPPTQTKTICQDPEITMTQNEKYVWLNFKMGEKNFEPEFNINHDANNRDILLMAINDIVMAYKLPGKVNWPIFWRYDYTDGILILELERVELASNIDQYWNGLEKDFTKTTNQQHVIQQLKDNYEYQMNFDENRTITEDPFLFYQNLQFVHDNGLHAYANYPFGTVYKFHITASTGVKYIFRFFPLPRELLNDRVTNRESFLKARSDLISTGEIQRIYVESGNEEDMKTVLMSDFYGRKLVKFSRLRSMLVSNGKAVRMKDILVNMPAEYKKVIFFGVSTGVALFFQPMLYLCLNTKVEIVLIYYNSYAKLSIFHSELNKLVAICEERLKVERVHPGKDGFTEEEDTKRFPNGAFQFDKHIELTSNLTMYKGTTDKQPEDKIFISSHPNLLSTLKYIFINMYGYKDGDIYFFNKSASLAQ